MGLGLRDLPVAVQPHQGFDDLLLIMFKLQGWLSSPANEPDQILSARGRCTRCGNAGRPHLGIWYFDRKDWFRQALIEAAFVAVGTPIAHLAYRLICERGNSSLA